MYRKYEDKLIRGYEDKYVLVASGPSLTQEQVDQCRGKASVIVINNNYKLAPWADHLYACDQNWWQWYENDPDLLNFKGKKWSQDKAWDEETRSHIEQKHNVTFLVSESSPGLSLKQGIIHQGSNSGYQAINLAYHLGAKQIILLGYDMQQTGGNVRWHGDHPNKGRPNYNKFAKFFTELANDVQKAGIEVVNCTTQTALTCFPRQSLDEVL